MWERDKQIGDVDRRADLGRVVVGQEADVGEGPAVEVVDHDDGHVGVGARDVAVLAVDGGLAAGGDAVPLETFEAAGAHGDGVDGVMVWWCAVVVVELVELVTLVSNLYPSA